MSKQKVEYSYKAKEMNANKQSELNFFCISRHVLLQTERRQKTEVQHMMIQKCNGVRVQSVKIQKLLG